MGEYLLPLQTGMVVRLVAVGATFVCGLGTNSGMGNVGVKCAGYNAEGQVGGGCACLRVLAC